MSKNEHEDEYDEYDGSTGREVAAATQTQLAALLALGDAAAAIVAANPRGGGDPLLRILKNSGAWVYAQDSIEVEEGSIWAVNPLQCEHGYIAWSRDKKAAPSKLGEVMVPITRSAADKFALPDVSSAGEWTRQMSLAMRCVSGEDKGLQVVFKSNSLGGVECAVDLIGKIGERARSGNREIVPLVQLSHTTYQHPKFGKTYKPVLKVIRWTTMDDDGGAAAPPPDKPVQPASNGGEPVRRRRSA